MQFADEMPKDVCLYREIGWMFQRPIFTTAMVLCAVACHCASGCGRGSPDTEGQPEGPAPSEPIAARTTTPDTEPELAHAGLPLSFVENKGQLDAAGKYILRGPRGSAYFTPSEIVFEVFERRAVDPEKDTPDQSAADEPGQQRSVVVRVSFPGANDDVTVEGRRELPGKVNILRGADPTEWQTNIRTFADVVYRELYPGVDLVLSGEKGDLTRTLVVRPEGDIEAVRMKYAGVESVELTEDGAIRLDTAIGTIRERPPTTERATGDTTVPLRIELQLTGESELVFAPPSQ